jgi:uncharacterized protein
MLESSAEPPELTALQREVNDFVEEVLGDHKPLIYDDGKIVRDAVFGFQWLSAHEWSLVDSPLVQRLRFVHQTAVAFLLYPCARHSRFEHSLGVAALAGRIAESLNQTNPGILDQYDIAEVRLAALLHDCGHGLFSHLGEGIVSRRFAGELKRI